MTLPTRLLWMLTLAVLLPGCGDAPAPAPPPPTATAPASIEGTVHDEKGRPAYKSVVRIYRRFERGAVSKGADESGQSTAIAEFGAGKASLDGPDMQQLASAECDGQGRFKLADIPPGQVLLATGDVRLGVWRQWITLEPGSTQKLEIKLPGKK